MTYTRCLLPQVSFQWVLGVLLLLALLPALAMAQASGAPSQAPIAPIYYNDHYYVIYPSSAYSSFGNSQGAAATFAASLTFCGGTPGHLVDITSAGEQAAVNILLGQTGVETWIGLTRSGPSTFLWSDNSAVSYTNWLPPNEPVSTLGYNCVYIDDSNQW